MKMIKFSVAFICILIFNVALQGQVKNFNKIPKDILHQLANMGVDDSELINKLEGSYFNCAFNEARGDFDFAEKRIAFLTGSNGKTLSDKRTYFSKERNRFEENSSMVSSRVYIFNETQKIESGGYDAVIVYWCKVLISIDDLISRIKQ